jgi:hypothetical protein
VPKLLTRAADVQASLWVLGRGGFAGALGEEQWLDLSAVDHVAPIYAMRGWATSTCASPGCNVLSSRVLTCGRRISMTAT